MGVFILSTIIKAQFTCAMCLFVKTVTHLTLLFLHGHSPSHSRAQQQPHSVEGVEQLTGLQLSSITNSRYSHLQQQHQQQQQQQQSTTTTVVSGQGAEADCVPCVCLGSGVPFDLTLKPGSQAAVS